MAQLEQDRYKLYTQGDKLLNGGHYKQAAVLYSRVLKVGPYSVFDLGNRYYRVGSCLYCQQKYEKALLNYKKAARLDSSIFQAYNGIGSCYSSLGEYDKAIEFFKESINESPSYDLPYINWTLALLLQGKEKEALDVFEEIKTRYEILYKKNIALEIYKDEIVFANERIANTENQDEIRLAEERRGLRVFDIFLILSRKFD